MTLAEEKASPLAFLTDNIIALTLKDSYANIAERRKALRLENPGTVDNISREVQKDVLLSNFMFTGLRCDLQKIFSVAPLFRIQHGLATGSQALPPYQLLALFGNSNVFMQASLSSDKSVTAWGNYRWSPQLVTKTQTSIGAGQTMFQFDNDYTGSDFSASLKAINPNMLEGGLTGILIGSYLQSVTPRFALGFEGVWQRAGLNARPETAVSYCTRYKGNDWIASAQYLAQGSIGVSYWRRLTERVEAGVDCQLQFAPSPGGNGGMFGGIRREGTTTVGAKYEFRASTFRAQIDSTGKVGCYLEKRVAPPVTVSFAGEIDHMKSTSKLGLAVSIEGAPEELQEAAERADTSNALPPPY